MPIFTRAPSSEHDIVVESLLPSYRRALEIGLLCPCSNMDTLAHRSRFLLIILNNFNIPSFPKAVHSFLKLLHIGFI